jgi:polynucleotide 5'-kinase involved in rRNA processing
MESKKSTLEQAIPFIQIEEESGKFVVSTEAMSILEQNSHSRKKLAVVVIAGPYRSGKSFLANRFLNRMKGFTIGSTV